MCFSFHNVNVSPNQLLYQKKLSENIAMLSRIYSFVFVRDLRLEKCVRFVI